MSLPNTAFLKGVGAFCVILGFVEIGLGAEVWAFVPGDKYGSWWAAMFVVVSGVIALVANNKLHLQVLIFFSSIASILCFSGMLVDSFGYRRVNELETCLNTDTGEYAGASSLEPQAAVCAQSTHKLCACVGDNDVCHYMDINPYRQDNCELILTKYTDLLLISAIFSTFCLAWVFILSVFSCVTYTQVTASERPASPSRPAASSAVVRNDAPKPIPQFDTEASAPQHDAVVSHAEDAPDSAI